MNKSAEEDFAGTLMQDALAAIERNQTAQSQLSRRDLVRTLFASSEGLLWLFREHIVEAASQTDQLSNQEAIALREEIYFVNDRGVVSTQRRYIPLTASIRLCARIAERLVPELQFLFDGQGWHDFQVFLGIRNRITHPKRSADLRITDEEANTCTSAFLWVTEFAVIGMEAANRARRGHLGEFRKVLERLKAGDPDTIESYRRILLNDDNPT